MRVERVVVAVFVVACRELRCDWSNLELSPPSNVPGLHSGEMAFESVPPEVTDVVVHSLGKLDCLPSRAVIWLYLGLTPVCHSRSYCLREVSCDRVWRGLCSGA